MLKTTTRREGEFTRIPDVIRIMSTQRECEVCRIRFGVLSESDGEIWRPVMCLHHIFARRFLSKHKLNPHDRLNMMALDQRCHGKAKKAEERLFQGDIFGYLQAMKQFGWPMSYIWRAARQYDLREVLTFFKSDSELR